MSSVFNKDRQFQCICILPCEMQRPNSPIHFKFVDMHSEHKFHTINDKTNMPIIIGTICQSLRVQKSTYVLYYNLRSLPSEKLLIYTMHIQYLKSKLNSKNMVNFHQKITYFYLALSIFMSINNSVLVISQSCGAGHPTLDK